MENLLRNLDAYTLTLPEKIQKELNRAITSSSKNDKQFKFRTPIDDTIDQPIGNGVLIERKKPFKDDEDEKLVKNVDPIKYLIKPLVPLICVLSLSHVDVIDPIKMLLIIAEHKKSEFDEKISTWFVHKNSLEFITNIFVLYVKKNSPVFIITSWIKMTLVSLIDKPSELLQFIGDSLTVVAPKLKTNVC